MSRLPTTHVLHTVNELYEHWPNCDSIYVMYMWPFMFYVSQRTYIYAFHLNLHMINGLFGLCIFHFFNKKSNVLDTNVFEYSAWNFFFSLKFVICTSGKGDDVWHVDTPLSISSKFYGHIVLRCTRKTNDWTTKKKNSI